MTCLKTSFFSKWPTCQSLHFISHSKNNSIITLELSANSAYMLAAPCSILGGQEVTTSTETVTSKRGLLQRAASSSKHDNGSEVSISEVRPAGLVPWRAGSELNYGNEIWNISLSTEFVSRNIYSTKSAYLAGGRRFL